MTPKALFFDIDGTLFSEIDRQVPQSAVLALKKARDNGHLIFINTGRTYSQTEGIRSAVEFDGLLCGCGTYIVSQGEVVYNREIPKERRIQIKQAVEDCDLEAMLEGEQGCTAIDHVSRIPYAEFLKDFLRAEGSMTPDGWRDDEFVFSKFCVLDDGMGDTKRLFDMLLDFHIIDRGEGFYECVPSGHSKATAIEFILKEYGIDLSDAWVFGDSMNDLSMFEYVPNAVLMEKHDEGLEPYASFITKTVEADGIEYALKHFGMI